MKLKSIKNKFESDFKNFFTSKDELLSQFWMLSEAVFEVSRLEFALNPVLVLDKEKVEKFEELAARLKNNEPIQYVIGYEYFYGEKFIVDESVLIPRPETEELIEWILDDFPNKNVRVLDIATGSGCIAISLKNNFQDSEVCALDISEKAINIAKQNNRIVNDAVLIVNADALKLGSNPFFAEKVFDVIVSNPPYVKESEKSEMKSIVMDFEPHLALFVDDDDPLIFYREIMKYSKSHLKKDGILYFEINQNLSKEMRELATDLGFNNIELKEDFRGNFRMMKLSCI